MLNRTSATLALVAVVLVLSSRASYGEDLSRYRDFQLGSDVVSVLGLTKAEASDAKTTHQRPAVLQVLQWRPRYFMAGQVTPQTDPVEQISFSFYENQLAKMVVDYDRERTAGMTDADMIAALSSTYGMPSSSAPSAAAAVSEDMDAASGKAVARWKDTESTIVLYRSLDPYRAQSSRIRLVVSSPRLEGLRRTADAQAVQLEQREAPQREIARRQQETEDARVSQEKARVANKAAFRP